MGGEMVSSKSMSAEDDYVENHHLPAQRQHRIELARVRRVVENGAAKLLALGHGNIRNRRCPSPPRDHVAGMCERGRGPQAAERQRIRIFCSDSASEDSGRNPVRLRSGFRLNRASTRSNPVPTIQPIALHSISRTRGHELGMNLEPRPRRTRLRCSQGLDTWH